MTVTPTETACGIGPGADCGCAPVSGGEGAFRLASFSRGERIALLAATLVVATGLTAAALTPDRLDAAPRAAQPGTANASCPTSAAPTPIAAATAANSTPATAAASAAATSAATTTTTSPSRTAVTAARRPAATRPATSTPSPVASAPTARGLVVTFGTYEEAPVRWRVLSETDEDLLLLSENVLTAGAFESDWERSGANAYAQSEVRTWLLDTFAPVAFSAEESAALLPHAGGAAGSDRVYLLCATEVQRHLSTAASRKAAPRSSDAAAAGYSGEPLTLTGGSAGWWLADPAADGAAKLVRADGTIASQPVYYADLGVRPAIRVDRDKVALALAGQGAQ